jgi:hypothetical protein
MIELAIDELDKISGGDPNLGSYVYRDGPGGWGIYVPQPPDPPTPHNPGVSAGSSAPSRSACSARSTKSATTGFYAATSRASPVWSNGEKMRSRRLCIPPVRNHFLKVFCGLDERHREIAVALIRKLATEQMEARP